MKKNLLLIILPVLSLQVFSQDLTLIDNFNKIPLGQQKYEIEGIVSSLLFKQSKISNAGIKDYDFIFYSNTNYENLLLSFYKSVLFSKKILFKYSLEEINNARNSYKNINSLLMKDKPLFKKIPMVSESELYGGEIGYGDVFNIVDPKISPLKSNSVYFKADLEFYEESGIRKAKIVGYNVTLERINFKNTELAYKTRWSSVDF